MTRPIKTLVATSLALVSWPAAAQSDERYQLVSGNDDALLFVDTRTMVRQGQTVTYWTLTAILEESERGPDMLKTRQTMYCSRLKYTLERSIGYRNNRQIEESANARTTDVIPNSAGENVFNYVCNGVVHDDLSGIRLLTEAEALELRTRMQVGDAAL